MSHTLCIYAIHPKEDVMKKLVRIGVVVVVVAAAAVFGYSRLKATQVSADETPTTAPVQRGTLSATVAAAGNLQAHQAVDLSFGQSGTVKAVQAAVGDRVKAGDLLAELDTADLELNLRSAEVSLKNAQNALAEARNPYTEQDISDAQASVNSAQAAYDKVAAGASQSDLASAQAAVTSAQAAYNAAVASANTSDSELVSAAATLEKARIALQSAQSAYDKVAWRGDAGATSQAQELQSATLDYDTAKAAYEALAATSKSDASSKIASAAASLQSARANLAGLKDQVTAADLASAQAALTQAQNNLAKLLAGPTATELDTAENGVETAQIAVDQAKRALEQALLVAPFDGVVTAVTAAAGESSSGAAITISDLDNLEVVVQMSEVDVPQIQTGQKVEITLDALTDVTLEGVVTQISPAGTLTSGVVNYPVTVALTRSADGVKTGMTANLSIITARKDNVLTVPNRAVKSVGSRKMVTLFRDGQQIPTPVEVGTSSDTRTEIISGLNEGDLVVVSTTASSSTNGGAMMGGPMMGGGGPPPGM
jgi:HlyD family secretion protein